MPYRSTSFRRRAKPTSLRAPSARRRAKSREVVGTAEIASAAPPARPRAKRPPAKAVTPRRSEGPKAAATFIPPMKALSVEAVPAGNWRLEIKLDGYRALAVIDRGRVELWSRNRKPLTSGYPEIAEALRKLKCESAVLDGEIVALDAAGRSRFQLLQGRGLGDRPDIVYYVFDLLQLDGRSWLQEPLEARQAALAALLGKGSSVVRLSPVFDTEPETLLEAARQQGLEGIIAKQAGSPYEPDRRSGVWLKCKVHGEQEFVIGGFTPPKNSRPHFGALLVGYYEGGKLLYAGKVGSGFDHARLGALHREFLHRATPTCPFANLSAPRTAGRGAGMTASAMREVTWVKPDLVAQVRFTEWTDDGLLRHPVFLGLRNDKRAAEVVREAPPAKEEG